MNDTKAKDTKRARKCGMCGLLIADSEIGLRHMGFSVAHQEYRCHALQGLKIESIADEVERLLDVLRERHAEEDVLSEKVIRLRGEVGHLSRRNLELIKANAEVAMLFVGHEELRAAATELQRQGGDPGSQAWIFASAELQKVLDTT